MLLLLIVLKFFSQKLQMISKRTKEKREDLLVTCFVLFHRKAFATITKGDDSKALISLTKQNKFSTDLLLTDDHKDENDH